jgi:hypothetical protein
VICIEIAESGITKAHFQQYECKYPDKRQAGMSNHHKSGMAPHELVTGLLGTSRACHDCIDEHIQFEKPSTNFDFAIKLQLADTFPQLQQIITASLISQKTILLPPEPLNQQTPFHTSVIKSTVLLI